MLTKPQRAAQHLIVYAKPPRAGLAKTRLGAAIGEKAAAGLYARLLYRYLFDLIDHRQDDTQLVLSVASVESVAYFQEAFPELDVRAQIEGDLGERMAASFERSFAQGAERVVLTGTDIPDLTASITAQAFRQLAQRPVVLGPAQDGGYYLIGMQSPGANLFQRMVWSRPNVLERTLKRAETLELQVGLLPELSDIDTVDDLRAWRGRSSLRIEQAVGLASWPSQTKGSS